MFVEYAWLIPLLPGLSFVISLFLGKHIKEGGGPVVVGAMGVALALSLAVLLETLGIVGGASIPFEQNVTWLSFPGGLHFEMGILVDNLSAFMAALVSLLVLLIGIYSIGYMHEEGDRKPRYYAEFSLFAVGMLGTVLSTNYLQLLIFWEIMGLCSYLLIGFWYDKPSAASAAKRAFLVTRIGDVLLLVGIVIAFLEAGTLNFLELLHDAPHLVAPQFLTVIPLLIFGGAIGKSAQFPLHLWLPDAMEGPTTVSALIHAATMVKAGVFLTARTWPFIVESGTAALFIAAIGGFTALFAASMALVNVDIKKVLAYSTISQLGYMILALGAGAALFAYTADHGHGANPVGYTAGIFHLMNHAFFKALLFLGAGAVIHAVHTNDMTEMGGLKEKMPVTAGTMLVATLAISGIPPFSGFWSKDEILAATYEIGVHEPAYMLLWVLGIVTAFMTAFYMFRLWFLTFAGEPRDEDRFEHAHEAGPSMTGPLMVLGGLAAVGGLFTLIPGTGGFGAFIYFEHAHALTVVETLKHVFTAWQTYLSLGLAVLGFLLARAAYVEETVPAETFTRTPLRRRMHRLLADRYGYDAAADRFGSRVVYGTARALRNFDDLVIDGVINGLGRLGILWAKANDWFDLRVVDGAVDGLRDLGYAAHDELKRRHTGLIPTYANAIVLGALAVLLLLGWLLPTALGGGP